MRYKMVCPCGAVAWVRGTYDHTVNALELSEHDTPEWEGGDESCNHDKAENTDSEPDDDDWMDSEI